MDVDNNVESAITTQTECGPDVMVDLLNVIITLVLIIFSSNVICFITRPLGLPRFIAQMLMGVLLGPSALSRFKDFADMFFPEGKKGFLRSLIRIARVVFMFLVGLETDQNYMKRSLARASILAGIGLVTSAIVVVVLQKTVVLSGIQNKKFLPDVFSIFMLSATASPIVVRMTTELKLATTEVGRVATISSLINDMFTLGILGILTLWLAIFPYDKTKSDSADVGLVFVSFVLVGVGATSIGPLTRRLNDRTEKRRQLRYSEVTVALAFALGISVIVEILSQNGMLAAFVIGAMMPRERRAVRTLIDKLTYPVNSFVLPIYFGSMGMTSNLGDAFQLHLASLSTSVVLVGPGIKIMATYLVTHYCYGMAVYDSFLLSVLLTAKGHADLALLSLARSTGVISDSGYSVVNALLVVSSILVGLLATIVVKSRRRNRSYMHDGLERQRPDSDHRMIACVHSPRELPTVLNLMEASRGTDKAPLISFLMHLIEFTEEVSIATQLFYHQYEDYDEYEYGREDAIQINNAVDSFNIESGFTIRQLTAVSGFPDMHHDVLDACQTIRAAVVLLPFHRRQTMDGKMDKGNDGIRIVNQKMLKEAKCTVGLLVDRGLGRTTQISALHGSHHIAVLFFGGPDDREALAYGCRMVDHPSVNLTVIRFQPSDNSSYEASVGMHSAGDEEVLMSLSKHEKEVDQDRDFLLTFYDRYVVTGLVSFVEKQVDNGPQTVTTLTAMEGMFSLFIVGRGGRGISPLTTGIGDWEEYPELGTIGDLLASSDFTLSGSVLVIQQYRPKKTKSVFDEDDEFAIG